MMLDVPSSTQVLVIGGGPAGSYAAAALAREGINVVVLEADQHPRYHIGESMLPSIRHFLRFIGCEEKFRAHGFRRKYGAAFKLNSKPVVYTDFVAAGGPESYAWNVVRSEADQILFEHAASCGAHAFDCTKVESIQFSDDGRPVSASWSRKKEGSTGSVKFDYLVDASGRNGLLSTRHLHNRKFNPSLKNVANWGYWRGGSDYGAGTDKQGWPFFEALADGSGWCWYIPLHNGNTSVGVVQKQDAATARKRAWDSPGTKAFYLRCLQDMAPHINGLLGSATLVEQDGSKGSDIHSASDWSYSASTYALPHARIAGDAGCFVDPFFSSGMHVALTTALSAALTICAAIRGDCDEATAGAWHTKRVTETYTRFFLVVSATLKQIGAQDDLVISDVDEEGFERAFEHFKPVIQGTVDTASRTPDHQNKKQLTQADIAATVEFCAKRFANVTPQEIEPVVLKLKALGIADSKDDKEALADVISVLTPDEYRVFEVLQSRKMLRQTLIDDDAMFSLDAIDGLTPRLARGKLGLGATADELRQDRQQHPFSAISSQTHLSVGAAPGRGKETNAAEPVVDRNGCANANGHHNGNGHTNGHQNDSPKAPETETVLTAQDIDRLLEPVRNILSPEAAPLNEASRLSLMMALRATADGLEKPFDTVVRLSTVSRMLPLIRVGHKLHIFESLAQPEAATNGGTKKPMTSAELSRAANADPELVKRITRALAVMHTINQVAGEPDTYVANGLTNNLADPNVRGIVHLFHEVQAPTYQQFPDYLEGHGYRNMKGSKTCLWHERATRELGAGDGDGEADSAWHAWLKTQPVHADNYNKMMTVPRYGTWLDVMTDQELGGGGDDVVLVDVGGNEGQQCARLLVRHPHLRDRIVLQDLPGVLTVASAKIPSGVRVMGHDFFTPQPIRAARFYFLRNIVHNYHDDDASRILRAIAGAMTSDSRLLIDASVLATSTAVPAAESAVGLDLNMMVFFGSLTRDREQYTRLLKGAGLDVVDVRTYAPATGNAVIVAALI